LFASEEDFTGQLERGLVSCPLCGDTQIQKMLSAPRLNLRTGRNDTATTDLGVSTASPESGPESGVTATGLPPQARWLRALRELMANTEDVGERFADEARSMHSGETDQRNIRGSTSPEVALELIEEGIEVMPLPYLPALKETLQ
jgi:hypothetical protein